MSRPRAAVQGRVACGDGQDPDAVEPELIRWRRQAGKRAVRDRPLMELAAEDTKPGALSGRVQRSQGEHRSPPLRPYRNEPFVDPRRRWSAEERESLDGLLPLIHVELLKAATV